MVKDKPYMTIKSKITMSVQNTPEFKAGILKDARMRLETMRMMHEQADNSVDRTMAHFAVLSLENIIASVEADGV